MNGGIGMIIVALFVNGFWLLVSLIGFKHMIGSGTGDLLCYILVILTLILNIYVSYTAKKS